MENSWRPKFVFASCQYGAEVVVKSEMARRQPELRLAFSRPGFITFKLPEESTEWQTALPRSPFTRASGFSLGKVQGAQATEMAAAVWQLPEVVAFLETNSPVDLHVWQRDAATPGKRGFEPGTTALATEVREQLGKASTCEAITQRTAEPVGPAPRNQWVLDVVLVEPGEWWIGCHRTEHRTACWPGGVPDLQSPEDPVSRAYMKLSEALQWSALPIARDDRCVEIGSSPGGASQRLLEAGLEVLGVDPAAMDDSVLAHPSFTHIRKRAGDVRRKTFSDSHWLFADVNATPTYTLDAVEDIVTHSSSTIRGMILTLKLTNWDLAEELPALTERVKSWGYQDVRLRQLAFNGKEICLVALRNRSQRRLQRRGRATSKRHRVDAPHSSVPGPHGQES
ncbi:SAM-dependent methyltransferase [Adhaeretor mobilis]|uniref:Ribosomal RNA large subunit methyltransferase M n=1 Tax=Adhaeretor mobilis TaxID=1930276 RepID=A0A517MVY0_9BACT|nr:SAM-dependent methyltransferase [Adhaeretor mobilis]QDS99026.1 Ribosomal RNA large subunit methyltransferase M [Adhaeretor mobilis]